MEKTYDYEKEMILEIYDGFKYDGLNGCCGSLEDVKEQLYNQLGWYDSFTNVSGMYTKGSIRELKDRINQNGMMLVDAGVDTHQSIQEIDSCLRAWVFPAALNEALNKYNQDLKMELLDDKEVGKFNIEIVNQIVEEFEDEERLFDFDDFIERCEAEQEYYEER